MIITSLLGPCPEETFDSPDPFLLCGLFFLVRPSFPKRLDDVHSVLFECIRDLNNLQRSRAFGCSHGTFHKTHEMNVFQALHRCDVRRM